MPTDAHPEQPASYEAERAGETRIFRTAAARSRADERQRIVRVIASQPAYLDWLQDKAAALLRSEAERLITHGHRAAGIALAQRADGYANGDLSALAVRP